MGNGDDELGKILIKGFIYALSQMETHPDTILFYNGGAKLTTEDSERSGRSEKDGRRGVEILTCGNLPEALWTDGETDGWKSYRYVYDCRAYDRCR